MVGKLRCPACRASFGGSGRLGRIFAPSTADDEEETEAVVDAGGGDEDAGGELAERPRRPARRPLFGVLVGCGGLLLLVIAGAVGGAFWFLAPNSFPEQTEDYPQARAAFKTRLVRQGPAPQPWDQLALPRRVTQMQYASGKLHLKAWVSSPLVAGGPRQPAVLFLHGGFAFDEEDWIMARPFRDAGYVVMTPMLRGENGLQGAYTMFYDEVDDVLAAAEALAALPHVDPNRVYVAGHSAGGTLALLAAMTSTRFRAASSFSGSPDQIAFAQRAADVVPFDAQDPREFQMRSPLAFPRSFKCPVRLYHGDRGSEFLLAPASQKVARLARAAGLDVEAVTVSGDHMSAVLPAMRRCIQFFQHN
jgi:dienelactone hydrolase